MRMINSNVSLFPLQNLKYLFMPASLSALSSLVPHSLKRWNGNKWTSRRRPALGLALATRTRTFESALLARDKDIHFQEVEVQS